MNNLWGELREELLQAYSRHAGSNGNVTLPSKLTLEMDGDTLLLGLDANAVSANMQTDAAAFEAWALILRLWLGAQRIPKIVLDWSMPAEFCGHYQRFLYRAAQFRTLFPEWFDIAHPKKLEACGALTHPQPILNVAKGKPRSQSKATKPEALWEFSLIADDSFRQHFGLKTGLVDRQFPVGLFAGEVSKYTRIFTGGKSAIDIVGLAEDGKFFLFELKAGDNISAGTLSELLLYTGLIREAAQTPPRIAFEVPRKSSRACIFPEHVKACTGIHAVMLVERMHPLLDRKELLDMLNTAAAEHWNGIPGCKPVCFSQALLGNLKTPNGRSAWTPSN